MKFKKEQYFQIIEKALQNAEELIVEAEILEKNGKNARAYTLFQFCLEEVGKAFLAFQFVLKGNIEDANETKKFFNDFKSHTVKTETSQGIDFMFALKIDKSPHSKKMIEEFIFNRDDVTVSNNYKNYSLYTSYIDGEFYKPSEIITNDMLDKISKHAKFRLQVGKPFIKIGIDNYDALFKTRDLLNEEEASIETQKKIKELLNSKFD
ncbi:MULTISPECIES: AbiV family abortive infection protein [Flavobacterium]|uniref:AbiV family abortive infection protein n=1 Tax=Flavobacterium TaxID=237 RepID=UPI00118414B4|nr:MULTISPECIES: AbiV family abortive infection protein [Flavobacterium]MCR4032489.1 AbiV family abortive infection protein [Flavobacterium panacis]